MSDGRDAAEPGRKPGTESQTETDAVRNCNGACGGVRRFLLPANWLIGVIAFYKYAISPWLPRACRFEPSCSLYAMEALRVHGLWRGGWLAIFRLLRCNPFCKGGYDPVPPKNNGNGQTASASTKMWRDK
ncbi:MAG: membrane protein insertion efficiency factor YidD [Victivallaceae bacterium]|nr:membrane protein insertion efficiency factor YidD [Victivallaceae bacterium]